VGRPTKYNPTMCVQVEKLAKLGCTNDEMADFFEVGATTFDRWLANHEEFRGACARGRVPADADVADSLHGRACGFVWIEQTAVKVRTGQYTESIEIVNLRRVVPPDTQAGMFWLQNRQPKRWKRVSEPELGDVNEAASELQRIAQASRATSTG